jgi:hypothetical protein
LFRAYLSEFYRNYARAENGEVKQEFDPTMVGLNGDESLNNTLNSEEEIETGNGRVKQEAEVDTQSNQEMDTENTQELDDSIDSDEILTYESDEISKQNGDVTEHSTPWHEELD